jgi:hypothetical protein
MRFNIDVHELGLGAILHKFCLELSTRSVIKVVRRLGASFEKAD